MKALATAVGKYVLNHHRLEGQVQEGVAARKALGELCLFIKEQGKR